MPRVESPSAPVPSDAKNANSLVERIEAMLELPMLCGAKYRFLDFNGVEIGSGTLKKGLLKIPAQLPVFSVEISQ